ncbi:MAG: PQQ-binding-like beta-propeller repeat protein [Armatimonadetes bacterium]|nr:PQQ-binding-like beta-propeller repeat protein [Armatimonadota bacterium]
MRDFLVVTIAALTAPMASAQDTWETARGDHARTGDSRVQVDPQNLTKVWSTGNDVSAARIVGDRIVARYRGNDGTRIQCFDASTGNVQWSVPTSYLSDPPEVFGDYVAYTDGAQGSAVLTVASLATGQTIATFGGLDAMNGSVMALPKGGQNFDLILATSSGGRKFKFNGTSLSADWQTSMSLGGDTTPTLAGGYALFAGVGHYYSVNLQTGIKNMFHEGNVSGGGGTMAAFDEVNSRVFIRGIQSLEKRGVLSAFKMTTQGSYSKLWDFDVAQDFGAPAISADGDVFVVDRNRLVRFDGATGAIEAESAALSAFDQAPVLSNGLVWVGTPQGAQAFDTGSLGLVATLPSKPQAGFECEMNMFAVSGETFCTYSQYGSGFGKEGLTVYAVPEPSATMLALALVPLVRKARRKPALRVEESTDAKSDEADPGLTHLYRL